jgi:hypothetical protein
MTNTEAPPARPEYINSRGPGHRAGGTAVLAWAILSVWLKRVARRRTERMWLYRRREGEVCAARR